MSIGEFSAGSLLIGQSHSSSLKLTVPWHHLRIFDCSCFALTGLRVSDTMAGGSLAVCMVSLTAIALDRIELADYNTWSSDAMGGDKTRNSEL